MRNLEEDRRFIKLVECTAGKNETETIALHAIERAIAAESKVEEMQKTLEWYADEKNWWSMDRGERARQALKGDNQ